MREFWVQFQAAIGSLRLAMLSLIWRRGASGDGYLHPHRIHVFAGSFASETEMYTYCYMPVTPHGPEQLNLDMPEAPFDTSKVEAAFGDKILPRLAAHFGRKDLRRFRRRMGKANVLIFIPTRAFEGLSYNLRSTARLRYIGHAESMVPAVRAMAQ